MIVVPTDACRSTNQFRSWLLPARKHSSDSGYKAPNVECGNPTNINKKAGSRLAEAPSSHRDLWKKSRPKREATHVDDVDGWVWRTLSVADTWCAWLLPIVCLLSLCSWFSQSYFSISLIITLLGTDGTYLGGTPRLDWEAEDLSMYLHINDIIRTYQVLSGT